MPSLVRNATVGGTTSNVTGLNCTTALSVSLWARQQGSNATDIIRQRSAANASRDGWSLGFTATEARLDILGTAASTNYFFLNGSPHRDGKWHHYVATYDSVTNQIRGYLDGKLRTTVNNATQDISANASCSTVWNPNSLGNGFGWLIFDLQILPDIIVPPQDAAILMNPLYKYPGVKGRYFGLNFNTTAAGTGACIDESGNGNNLTISPSAFQQGEEPPWRSTYQ